MPGLIPLSLLFAGGHNNKPQTAGQHTEARCWGRRRIHKVTAVERIARQNDHYTHSATHELLLPIYGLWGACGRLQHAAGVFVSVEMCIYGQTDHNVRNKREKTAFMAFIGTAQSFLYIE